MNNLAQLLNEPVKKQGVQPNLLATLMSNQDTTQPMIAPLPNTNSALTSNILPPNDPATRPQGMAQPVARPQPKTVSGLEKAIGTGLTSFMDGYNPRVAQGMRQATEGLRQKRGKEAVAAALASGDFNAASQASYEMGDSAGGLELQDMGMQREQQAQAQQQAQHEKGLKTALAGMKHMQNMTPEQRVRFAQENPQFFEAIGVPDLDDVQDLQFNDHMAAVSTALGIGPEPTPKTETQMINNELVERDPRTGEWRRVYQGKGNLPTGMYWDENTQSAQYYPEYLEQENRAQGMTPYQQAQINMQREKMQQEQDKWEAEQEAGPKPDFDTEFKFRSEFNKHADTFSKVRDSFARISAAKDSPAGDIALIFNFMKMLDPGSVVREGEFATAQNATGVPQRVQNTYNQLMSGERLSAAQRTDFLTQAQLQYKSAESTYSNLEQQYVDLAELYGIPAERGIIDYRAGASLGPNHNSKQNSGNSPDKGIPYADYGQGDGLRAPYGGAKPFSDEELFEHMTPEERALFQ